MSSQSRALTASISCWTSIRRTFASRIVIATPCPFTEIEVSRGLGPALSPWPATGEDRYDEDVIKDPHFVPAYQDRITKLGEPWFDHLRKFVDNGAAAFKLDGSNQICFHPDRKWRNGMEATRERQARRLERQRT